MEDDPVGYPTELWQQMAKLDLVGLMLGEQWGGSGMTLLEGVVLYEELGRSLAPVPHFVSAVMAGRAIESAGSDAVRQEWLPRIALGDAVVTTAWLEPEGGYRPRGVQLRADAVAGGFRLNGVKRHVPFAGHADAVLVLARTGPDPEDVDLFLVDSAAPGLGHTQQMTLASDTQYRLDFHDVEVGAEARIGEAGSGWQTWSAVLKDGLVLQAAQAVGAARQALDITVQYAKDRHQFDKPLGAFQALAHYLADATTAVDGSEQLVHEAAWAGARGLDTARLAPMAKLFANRTFRDLTAMAQQLFGGIGFTVEFDIQLYFRRAKQWELSWCDTRRLEEMVADAVLG
jgi:alkylation response protein AidB-like acyl-CoA dehydrogenase